MHELPDAQLVILAQSGDKPATELLLRRYAPRIYRCCRRLCADPEELEEVYQDTLIDVVRYLPRFRGEAGLLTWAYTIARTQWNRRLRRKRGVTSRRAGDLEISTLADRLVDPADEPDDRMVTDELRRALEAAMTTLTPVDRDILLLRDLEGFSAPEVAARTGLTIPAVKTRLHRARSALRAALRERVTLLRSGGDDQVAPPSHAVAPQAS
jgi:RNA polymerase sigma-70 factor (ECF subfamily)